MINKTVKCSRCKTPIYAGIMFDTKVYCSNCAEKGRMVIHDRKFPLSIRFKGEDKNDDLF